MTYAKIENGVVVNAVVADEAFAAEHGLIELTPGAGIGWTYSNGLFTPPQPFPSWTLNQTTNTWEPPIPHPSDGNLYSWDEPSGSWKPIQV